MQLLLTSAVASQMIAMPGDPSMEFCAGALANPGDDHGQNDASLIRKAACSVCVFTSQAPVLPTSAFVRINPGRQIAVLSAATDSAAAPAAQYSPRTSQGPPLNV